MLSHVVVRASHFRQALKNVDTFSFENLKKHDLDDMSELQFYDEIRYSPPEKS